MKKHLCLCLTCAVFLLTFCSCKSEKAVSSIKTKSNTPKNNDFTFLIEDSGANLISIPIPKNEKFDEKTVKFIEDFIEKEIFTLTDKKFDLKLSDEDIKEKNKDYEDYYIVMDSKISFSSDQAISIVFDGLLNKKSAAHPVHYFFTLNFNPETLETISFSENYIIDENLYVAFSKNVESELLTRCGGKWPDEWKSFSEAICSKEEFLKNMKEEKLYFFYTDDGIGISYPVEFSLGNHIEAIIPYSKLHSVKAEF